MFKRSKFATIDYTNWRGERRLRDVRPIRIEYGSNEWHKEPHHGTQSETDRSDQGDGTRNTVPALRR